MPKEVPETNRERQGDEFCLVVGARRGGVRPVVFGGHGARRVSRDSILDPGSVRAIGGTLQDPAGTAVRHPLGLDSVEGFPRFRA